VGFLGVGVGLWRGFGVWVGFGLGVSGLILFWLFVVALFVLGFGIVV